MGGPFLQFNYHTNSILPPLAWCATIQRGHSGVSVHHGASLEARPSFFVEGAWDGEFSLGDFDRAQCLVGTGGRAYGESLVFSTPSHPLQRLHIIRNSSELHISPSLAFALARSGSELDPGYIRYQTDFQTFVKDIKHHVGEIPLKGGNCCSIIHFRNIRVTSDLEWIAFEKPSPPRWNTFQDYEAFLLATLQAVVENARCADRRLKYSLTCSLSSGYDSSACAALAREVGCRHAISFKSSRALKTVAMDDSGEAVAGALGLSVDYFDRLSYRTKADYPEAEFVASGELGQEVYLSAAEELLAGKILITGDHGDRVWDRLVRGVTRDIPRKSSAGCSLTEFRLRVGFLHLPLPLIGAMNHPDLAHITHSDEMKPWTLWTRYDRPIARRILEQRGVPRDAFATEKKAVSVLLNSRSRIMEQLSPESNISFSAYAKAISTHRRKQKQTAYECMYRLYRLYRRVLFLLRLDRIFALVAERADAFCPVPHRFREDPGLPSFLVHWGLEKIRTRYLAGSSKGPVE